MAEKEYSLFFQCECKSRDHLVEFELQDWAAEGEMARWDGIKLVVAPCLNPNSSLLKRVWIAIRYIFKRPPTYSYHFDEIIIGADKLEPLEKMIRRIRAVYNVRKATNDRRDRADSGNPQT